MTISNFSFINEALVAKKFILINSGSNPPIYRGFLSAKKRNIECEIHIVDTNFMRLPNLKILDNILITKSVAHFDTNGFYCYVGTDENILDKYDPKGAIASCLRMMENAIESHISNDLVKEISAEFPQHWLPSSSLLSELSLDGDRIAFVRGLENKRIGSDVIVEEKAKRSCLGDFLKDKKKPIKIVCCLNELTFFNGQKQPQTLEELMTWANSQSSELADKIISSFKYLGENLIDTILIESPNALIGITVDFSTLPPNLLKRKAGANNVIERLSAQLGISRFITERVSENIILERNMQDTDINLADKRIALLGCGTIGSHLAKMLVQCGAGSGEGTVVLIDNQNLEAGNVGRHFLGINRIGQNKAIACTDEIRRLFPFSGLKGIRANIEDKLQDLNSFDLIIDATGEEPLSVIINDWLKHEHLKGCPIDGIFVWLFGNALAAQAILVQDNDSACFKCLKPKQDNNWRYEPRKNPRDITQIIDDCGQATFVPYGVSGSVVAAALGCNIALDWANHKNSPRLRTMRIDMEATKTTKDVNAPKSEHCPCCFKLKI